MADFVDEIYYMLVEGISEQCMQDSRRKILMIQKSALMEEIILRLGDDGEKLLM